jgi:putative transposase
METATVTQIAKALGISRVAANNLAKKWQAVNETGVARYDIDALIGLKPVKIKGKLVNAAKVIRRHLLECELSKNLDTVAASMVPAVKPAKALPALPPAQLPALTELTRHQMGIVEARMFFMRLIERRAIGQSVKAAQREIVKKVQAGEHSYAVMALAANDRTGKGTRSLSQPTVMRWWGDYRNADGNPSALAPQDADVRRIARTALLVNFCRDYKPGSLALPSAGLPFWLPWFMDAYRQGSKPSINDAIYTMDQEMPAAIERPSYDQVNRISRQIPEVYLQKYRLTGAEYRAILGFNRRDFSMDDPFTVGQIDGHSFKAYVAHPTTGAHFHPEVCGVICMTTKVLAGWSIGVAESAQTVADAYRHACTNNENKPWGGVFAIIEADRGSGNLAKVNSDELTGRFARLGTEFLPPEHGGNPQGHGGVERSNQSIWIRAAKRLETYTGKDMDRVTQKKIYTRLEKDLKPFVKEDRLGTAPKTSKKLLSWDEFIAFLFEEAIRYNNAPHSALPMMTDPKTGRRRNMSPFESMAEHIAKGWKPTVMAEELLEYAFMPHEPIHVKRCEFTLRGNQYHSYELHQWHDRDMIACFDIHDPMHVTVLSLDEQVVTIANWKGNRIEGQPVSVKDQATKKRAKGQIRLHQRYIDQREAETRKAVVIEHSPAVLARAATPLPVKYADAEDVDTSEMTKRIEEWGRLKQHEKYERWCRIDAAVQAGQEASAADLHTWKTFPDSAAWKTERLFDPKFKDQPEEEKP